MSGFQGDMGRDDKLALINKVNMIGFLGMQIFD